MRTLHEWDLSYANARQSQMEPAGRVQVVSLQKEPRFIARLDCAFSRDGRGVSAAAVVLEVAGSKGSSFDLMLVETASAERESDFPYILGLLSFLEAPVHPAAARRLSLEPDLYVIDVQGVTHHRRLALASHLGLFLDKSTIGCAKSRLIGVFDDPGSGKGVWSPPRYREEMVGAVVRARSRLKPAPSVLWVPWASFGLESLQPFVYLGTFPGLVT